MKRVLPFLLLLLSGCHKATFVANAPFGDRAVPAVSEPIVAVESTRVEAQAPTAQTTVISTGDGDTLRINRQGQAITVRLACVDAPESDQPGGQEAAARLRQLLPRGQAVEMHTVDRDRYGREVAELFVGNQSVNLLLVREGFAVVYSQYLYNCAANQDQYLQAERNAQSDQRGIWSQRNPVMPWEWRHGQRNSRPSAPVTRTTPTYPIPSAPVNLPTSTPPGSTPSNLPACVNSDCNCADFSTRAEAQRVLNAFPGDPFGLDRDRDGVACETLP